MTVGRINQSSEALQRKRIALNKHNSSIPKAEATNTSSHGTSLYENEARQRKRIALNKHNSSIPKAEAINTTTPPPASGATSDAKGFFGRQWEKVKNLGEKMNAPLGETKTLGIGEKVTKYSNKGVDHFAESVAKNGEKSLAGRIAGVLGKVSKALPLVPKWIPGSTLALTTLCEGIGVFRAAPEDRGKKLIQAGINIPLVTAGSVLGGAAALALGLSGPLGWAALAIGGALGAGAGGGIGTAIGNFFGLNKTNKVAQQAPPAAPPAATGTGTTSTAASGQQQPFNVQNEFAWMANQGLLGNAYGADMGMNPSMFAG
jgi:hypothetical protein